MDKLNKLSEDIEKLDALCADVVDRPEDRRLVGRLVAALEPSVHPLKPTGRSKALDNALQRAATSFETWRPLIAGSKADPRAWAGELRTALFNVRSELGLLLKLFNGKKS